MIHCISKFSKTEIGPLKASSLSLVLEKYQGHNFIIIVDENSHDACLEYFLGQFPSLEDAEVVLLPNGEENKVMEVCFQVWQSFTKHMYSRSDLVINLGGGVVCDMGGFIASIFKRGMNFINIPTSLLAMVDASIGGKNGIDLDDFKNQLGTIRHPSHVFIDKEFLKTLPVEEVFNGYAEMLKHALIKNKSHWEEIKNIHSEEELIQESIIYQSVLIKSTIIDEDPNEGGIRKLLNFGHTVGHALESFFMRASPISHGHAVALGMCAEAHISFQRAYLSQDEFKEVESTIIRSFPMVSLSPENIKEIIQLMYQDKKNSKNKILCSLLTGIGKADFNFELNEDEIGNSLLHLTLLARSVAN